MANLLAVLLGVALLLATSQGALAQAPAPPAALVLDVSGPTTPALKPYREIPTGTTVTLAPSARLVLLHYDTCRTMTMNGGSVSFTAGTVPVIRGASSHSDVRGQCPRRLAPSGSSATTIFRSVAAPAVNLPVTPTFVLVGQRADEFVRVRILRQGEEIVAGPLEGPRFQWPVGTPPLAPGDYQLSLVPARQLTPPVVVNFKAGAIPPAADGMTLIAIDWATSLEDVLRRPIGSSSPAPARAAAATAVAVGGPVTSDGWLLELLVAQRAFGAPAVSEISPVAVIAFDRRALDSPDLAVEPRALMGPPSGRLAPEALTNLTNQYLGYIIHQVEATGGCVDKFIGDAAMAIWGAPAPDARHASHTVRAALAAASRIRTEAEAAAARGERSFSVKIGLSSGPAVVGNVGTERRYNYTAVGETVGVASRLEGAPALYACAIVAEPPPASSTGVSVLTAK